MSRIFVCGIPPLVSIAVVGTLLPLRCVRTGVYARSGTIVEMIQVLPLAEEYDAVFAAKLQGIFSCEVALPGL